MSKKRIADRYARALFRVINEDSATAEGYAGKLSILGSLLNQDDAAQILKSPVMPLSLKIQILDFGLKQIDADDLFGKFVRIVAETGRVALIPEIADAFQDMLNERLGQQAAILVSCQRLEPEVVAEVTEALSRTFGTKIIATTQVDPTLLGGIQVRVGNKLLDYSIKSKLEALASSANN